MQPTVACCASTAIGSGRRLAVMTADTIAHRLEMHFWNAYQKDLQLMACAKGCPIDGSRAHISQSVGPIFFYSVSASLLSPRFFFIFHCNSQSFSCSRNNCRPTGPEQRHVSAPALLALQRWHTHTTGSLPGSLPALHLPQHPIFHSTPSSTAPIHKAQASMASSDAIVNIPMSPMKVRFEEKPNQGATVTTAEVRRSPEPMQRPA